MNALLRGIIGGFSCGGAPRPSEAGSTRHPFGCVVGGGVLLAGESGGRAFNVLRAPIPQRGFLLAQPADRRLERGAALPSVPAQTTEAVRAIVCLRNAPIQDQNSSPA